MKKFHSIISDDFFVSPFLIRKLALSDETYKRSDTYSGVRTIDLYEKYPTLVNDINKKILSLYNIRVLSFNAVSFFHLTDSNYKGGWAHFDNGADLAAIVYLNVDSEENLSCGTSLFRIKNYEIACKYDYAIMRESFLAGKSDEKSEAERLRYNETAYEETVRVGEKFNRLFVYDGGDSHCGQGYYGDGKNGRLTFLSFFTNIEIKDGRTPQRFQKEHYI